MKVGIDLGTTNSALATINDIGIPSIRGEIIPSVICFSTDGIDVGKTAKNMQSIADPNSPTVAFFKREMDDTSYHFTIKDNEYNAVDLSAMVLKKLKQNAESQLGVKITEAVITVPAYFKTPQREATIKAGKIAGLNVKRTINEPNAAAYAYNQITNLVDKIVLIFDLGGGTFDLSLLKFSKEDSVTLNTTGNHRLGGKDWDYALCEEFCARFENEYGEVINLYDDAVNSELLIIAENVKKDLSECNKAQMTYFYGDKIGRYKITRDNFLNITASLMKKVDSLMRELIDGCSEINNYSEIDEVVLVGGSTKMFTIEDYIIKTFGKPPLRGVNPDEAVALGAAIVANTESNNISNVKSNISTITTITDTNTHSLGMIAESSDRERYVNSIILPKNVIIPCSKTKPFCCHTTKNGDNCTEIYITEGESLDPQIATYLGKYTVRNIPHTKSGKQVILMTYDYDYCGIPKVSATLQSTKESLEVVREEIPGDVPGRFLVSPKASDQKVEYLNIILSIDVSGSMTGKPINDAKSAAHEFLEKIDLANTSFSILACSDEVRCKCGFSQDINECEKAINSLEVGETGHCNNAQPFSKFSQMFSEVNGKKVGIVLTDGLWSNQSHAVNEAHRCHSKDIDIVGIGFGSANADFIRKVSSSDDHASLIKQSELVSSFSTIAQELTAGSQIIL